jgi:hypothetical protein
MNRPLLLLALSVSLAVTTPVVAAPLLAIDINDRTAGDPTFNDPANTAPGFSPYIISSGTNSTGVVNGYTVNFDVFDDGDPNDGGAAGNQPGAFDDRDRVVPTTSPTLNQLYDDFLFVGGSAGPVGGVDLSISGGALLPNTPYRVSIYSYDGIDATGASGTQVRTANWLDGNNADAPVLTTVFTVNMQPTTDDQYKFTGVALTDATGKLLLKGRRATAADVSVYVNGVAVNAIPEPSSLALMCLWALVADVRKRRR